MNGNGNLRNLNHLVLNFYPDGYTIAVKLNEFPIFTTETILETAKISYDETSLLNYIENEELPPLLVEIIDSSPKLSQYKIWQNGCLVLEIRDKININSKLSSSNNNNNISTNNNIVNNHDGNYSDLDNNNSNNFVSYGDEKQSCYPSSLFVLLKPTNLSMINDVSKLTESSSWSLEDKLQLESQIVLYNSPPLYLEPQLTNNNKQQNSFPMQQNLINLSSIYSSSKRRYPFIDNNTVNRCGSSIMTQQETVELPPELVLQQFLATKREKKNPPAGHLVRFHRHKRHCKY